MSKYVEIAKGLSLIPLMLLVACVMSLAHRRSHCDLAQPT